MDLAHHQNTVWTQADFLLYCTDSMKLNSAGLGTVGEIMRAITSMRWILTSERKA